jgi:hypothetical protein
LDAWLPWGWTQPCYWNYGPGGYVYYQNNYYPGVAYPGGYYSDRYGADTYGNYGAIYQGDQAGEVLPAPAPTPLPTQTVNVPYQQVYDLAHGAPSLTPEEADKLEWLSLGVFSVTKAGDNDESRTLQLAVNKQGVLSGTYFNQKTGAHPLVGMVDKQTQRAAWYFADGEFSNMVFETAIHNLTQSETTMKVHYDSDDSGVWQLVRLEHDGAPGPAGAKSQGLP